VVSTDGSAIGTVTRAVRIGFRTSPQNTDWASLEAAWEEAGRHEVFDSGWLNDHLTDPGLERGGPAFESLTALAALAHHVPGKTVGQTVLAATFRHPAVLAKEALTLDHVTGGRYILALGAGWHVGEHETFGIELPPLRERFDRYESAVRVIKALFSEAATAAPGVTVDAPPWRLSGATMEPAPVRPGGPPLWLGGQGPRGLRIAARYADGWNFASNLDASAAGFVDRRDALHRACEAIGRDPAELTLSAQIIIPGDAAGRRQATERAIGFGRDGAEEILLTTPASEGAAGIRRLATEVAAPIRDAFG
jgi:alkanesulfonate monooxygenase SsuD/methylene tetrahydromethanopterin reductase-like flavin-dependent oxidoreductase (luciferase family)